MKKILVIGAGVSGLSSAIMLQDAGYEVTIWAKDVTPNTTSDVAAAFWYPYLCNPKNKAAIWAKNTYDYVTKVVMVDAAAGCTLRTAYNLYDHKVGEPWWKNTLPTYRHASKSELPPGYVDGYKIRVPLMDSSRYMPWLMEEFFDADGVLVQKTVNNFDSCFEDFDLVVNCTGLGSKELCNDDNLVPVRGQVIRASRQGLNDVVSDDESVNKLVYIIPRYDDVVIGGTADVGEYSLEPSDIVTKEIARKAKLIYPALKDLEILQIKVGLRPSRDEVRLETEHTKNGVIVHNYGHGGAGYTLSWGCAMEVVELVEKALA